MGVDRGPTALMSPTFFRKARTFAGFWALKQIRALKKKHPFCNFFVHLQGSGVEEFQRKCEPPNKIIAVSLIKPNTSRKKTTLLSLSLCTANGFFQRIFHGNFSPKHRKDFVHTRWVGYKSVWFGFFFQNNPLNPTSKGSGNVSRIFLEKNDPWQVFNRLVLVFFGALRAKSSEFVAAFFQRNILSSQWHLIGSI